MGMKRRIEDAAAQTTAAQSRSVPWVTALWFGGGWALASLQGAAAIDSLQVALLMAMPAWIVRMNKAMAVPLDAFIDILSDEIDQLHDAVDRAAQRTSTS